ncbi:MAG: MBOAT family protein [Alphaproteobacteria bacterium]|nr:MBOAT family protein [Alphaproteobacteria bacterium]
MLFNSYAFIFLFLPISVALYFALGRVERRAATAFLAAASFFFYGWWNPVYLWLLAASILFNYALALALVWQPMGTPARRALLIAGILGNLLVLGYYKYADFLLGTIGAVSGLPVPHLAIVLPIGISFFTFTQIAFLVDTARGEAEEYDLARYALFVTFFPHLLAGPLLHHKEMMPQFAAPASARFDAENLSVGLTIFIIGLIKKVVLADGMAGFAAPLFAAAAAGASPNLLQSWGGALAYTFQLYYDFSGYSDMAIGAARCFGILLPLNFDSPYKAANIIDFWRRWHMTLSRFLRDYLYVPLGGNRKGPARRYVNLFLTMLLGGLWHGAAWTFVAWGALHGVYLAANHGWQAWRRRNGRGSGGMGRAGRWGAILLTFLAVVIGWVVFRAESFAAALRILAGMAGLNGTAGPESLLGVAYGAALYGGIDETLALAALALVTFLAPNTQQFMARFRPALAVRGGGLPARLRPGLLRWSARPGWALAMAAGLLVALGRMSGVSPFLYYRF